MGDPIFFPPTVGRSKKFQRRTAGPQAQLLGSCSPGASSQSSFAAGLGFKVGEGNGGGSKSNYSVCRCIYI